MKRIVIFSALLILILTAVASAASFDGTVVSVIRGDTIIVARGLDLEPVIIAGLAAPELDQPVGADARQFVIDRLLGQPVTVDQISMNHDRQIVGVVSSGGMNIGMELIRMGLAWYDSRLFTSKDMASLEKNVRAWRIGLWAASHPTPPWIYRTSARGITPAMSKEVINIGDSDYGLIQHSLGHGFIEASWPAAGGIPNMVGGGPGSSSPGSSTAPGSTYYNGSAGPGSSAPGSQSPPYTVAPGSGGPSSVGPGTSGPIISR